MLRCLLDHSTFDCLINEFALDVQLPIEESSGGRFARRINEVISIDKIRPNVVTVESEGPLLLFFMTIH